MTGKKAPGFGLYRQKQKNRLTGEWEHVGAYMLDVSIPEKLRPELGVRRIKRSTGVLPGTRNAATVVKDMKTMVREIIQERDVDTLRKIAEQKLSLASAFAKWRTGRLHLAEPYEDLPVVKAWRDYLDASGLAVTTRENRHAVISALIRHHLLSETDVLGDLPERVEQWRKHYARTKQHSAFNQYRETALAFLKNGLRVDDESRLYRAVRRVRPLPQLLRKEHNPFLSPRDLYDFRDELRRRSTPNAKRFAASALFMAMHGLRPEEFARGLFRVDPGTGHLRIDGTKTQRAKRVVPLLFDIPDFKPPKVDTLNRTFERMKVPVRCRDFRRTYAVWCGNAGILQTHIATYMGHGDATMTQRYQRVNPNKEMLDHDRAKLAAWVAKEVKAARKPDKKHEPVSAFRFEVTSSTKNRKQLLQAIEEQKRADKALRKRLRLPGSKRES